MRGIRIRALHHGNLRTDYDVLVTGHPRYLLTRSDQSKPRIWCEVPSLTYIIEHPDGNVLFDASVHPNWEQEWLPDYKELAPWDDHTPEQVFEVALKRAGYGPEDIKYVFISHLHTDHAGNTRLFAGTDAKILIHEAEYKGVANLPQDQNFFLRCDYDVPGLKWTPLYGDQEILRDVYAISLPGHTWGTMGLMVHLEHSGTIILPSDAVYRKESYDLEHPSMISLDPEEWRRSLRKLKLLARNYDATIVPGHDHAVCHEGRSPIREEERLRLHPNLYE
jgi:N-acyl homoserine lactone hydrolase